MRKETTFEEAFPSQPFSELVRFGIWLGSKLRRLRQSDSVIAGKPAAA